ncbi:MAG TPA: acyl transferase [Saprospiraceae bacterium]|nr:acyl transferase [Saprospiraceae bacterium]
MQQSTAIQQERFTLIGLLSSQNNFFFDELALKIYQYQLKYNRIYYAFARQIHPDPFRVSELEEIPLLPVSAFKHHRIKTGDWNPEVIYKSSSTTGTLPSSHHIKNRSEYLANAQRCFELFYGPVEQYCFLALLPGYLERSDSSLIDMSGYFIQKSFYPQSGFFQNDFDELVNRIGQLARENIPTILLGVTFALLDMAEKYSLDFPELIVMETGGMKGRRKEIIRQEVHDILQNKWRVKGIHSEYGMTELMSQAYSSSLGIYKLPKTMKVVIRQTEDPLNSETTDRAGIMGIIDLANIDSCSFLLTDDLGRVFSDGSFTIIGRLDNSEIRGCNLMVSDL